MRTIFGAYIIIQLWFVLLSGALAWSKPSPDLVPSSCLRITLSILLESERYRDPEMIQLLKLYKNDPEFSGFLESYGSDYTSASSLRDAFLRRDVRSIQPPRRPIVVNLFDDSPGSREKNPPPSSRYHKFLVFLGLQKELSWIGKDRRSHMLVSLKKGDTVTDGVKSIILGDFLGAGNRTHIYSVQGQPGTVIRIPFESGGYGQYNTSLWSYVDDARYVPKTIPKSEILDYGRNYCFVISERAQGDVDGQTFLKTVNASSDSALIERKFRLVSLVKLLLKSTGDSIDENNIRSTARQFIWDLKRNDWLLVDWEGYRSSY